jgi:hypothetical protein
VIVDLAAPDRHHLKASDLGSWASLKGLERQLGPWPAELPQGRPTGEVLRYSPEPLKPRPGRDPGKTAAREAARRDLWDQYREGRRAWEILHVRGRQDAWATQRTMEKQRWSEFLASRRELLAQRLAGVATSAERRLIRRLHAVEPAPVKAQLFNQRARERAELKAAHKTQKFPGWREWVRDKAEAGDATAKSVWRGIRYRERAEAKVEAGSIEEGKASTLPTTSGQDLHLEALAWRAHKGVGVYGWPNRPGGVMASIAFADHGHTITGHDQAPGSLAAAVAVAAAKFGGRIEIQGSPAFQEAVLMEAARQGVGIINPDLQRRLQELKTLAWDEQAEARQEDARADQVMSQLEDQSQDVGGSGRPTAGPAEDRLSFEAEEP